MTDSELNTIIARLLGWPEHGQSHERWWGGRASSPVAWIHDRHGPRMFAPTTDIRDAWLVVDWLRAQDAWVSIAWAWSGTWRVLAAGEIAPQVDEEDDTAPRAICEVALAWSSAMRART